jgi:hypothetical protein
LIRAGKFWILWPDTQRVGEPAHRQPAEARALVPTFEFELSNLIGL